MKNKKMILIVGGVLILVILAVIFFLSGNKATNNQEEEQTAVEQVAIPTVSSQVKVDLESSSGNHEITLSVSNIPNGTQSIDYELSYQTAQQGLQGVIGTAAIEGSQLTKKLTLGTCSSGTCVYHQVVGNIDLTLRFTGDYGEKIFQKSYQL